ncbi:MAG: ATPase, T2SS/T4P/T4SS family [Candidatus Micrarchaeota archaeon]|nr:ATPase, T2SS/T4P/T4SS family [Candidatus Micrarchaeota archaeon]
MESLGWKIGEWRAGYKTGLRKLSGEEEELVASVAARIRERAQRGGERDDDGAEAGGAEAGGRGGGQLVKGFLLKECEEQGISIDGEQQEYLCSTIHLQTFGSGFLQPLLADTSLEEIALIGIGQPVYVFVRGGGWKKTDVAVTSADYFVALVNRLGRGLGRRLTAQQPRMNAVLEDGSRLHASMPPISPCELTIRKFSEQPLSPFDLLALGTYDAKMLSLLSLCLQADLPVLVAGNTASGKTTTLNALLCFVPASERMLLIEETPELRLPHPHQIRLLPFEEGGIGMAELVRDSLRMRPDRVVVGEVRTPPEVRALVESALSGQAKGCYATFHAQSSRDALLRMRAMGCLEADLEGIGVFIVQRRVSVYSARRRALSEARRVTEIAVANPADVMRPIAAYDGKRYQRGGMRLLMGKIAQGTGMGGRELAGEMKAREGFFAKAAGKKRGFESAFSEIQKRLFGGVEA